MDSFLSHERLLVIAPHADDETIGCGGLIARTKAAGGQVFVQVLTVGDLDHYDGKNHKVEGNTREEELAAAMEVLSVDDWEILIKDIEASVVLWGVDANKALEHASAAHRLSRERLIRFGNFAAAQIVREDIPFPKEEIPPFILSHDPDTIMQLMDFLEPEAKADFRSFGASLLRSAREEGFAIPEAEEKLKAMRHDAFSRKNFCWFRIHEKQTATRMKFAAVTI